MSLRRLRRSRAARRIILAALALFVGLGGSGLLGVRSGSVTASGDGYRLTVTYPRVSRPGLASPWNVEVEHAGGFGQDPVTLGTTADYFHLFDENGLDPDPSAGFSRGDLLVWEFEPPVGDTLQISFDARIGPAVQSGLTGRTVVLVDGRVVVEVIYRTSVMP
jgi:hypothetical protein